MDTKIHRTFTKTDRHHLWLALAVAAMEDEADEQSLITYKAHTYVADQSSYRYDHLTGEKSVDYVIFPCAR